MKMRYFIPEITGTLIAVEGVEELREDPRVSEVDLEFAPGELILTPPDGFEFPGYMSVLAPTLEEADAVLEELYPRVRFHIAPQAEIDREGITSSGGGETDSVEQPTSSAAAIR